ncbi:MAG: DUF3782 domain-containing protein [Candidatus Calescibacterium sp.]|nr:DUF3782 domain-containing protein [Candidatus Calescibacterium sp.]
MGRTKRKLQISDEKLKYIIIEKLPKLLEKEPSLKEYIYKVFTQKFADKEGTEQEIKTMFEELKLLRIDSEKRFEETTKRNAELSEELKKLRIDSEKRFEETTKRNAELSEELKKLRIDSEKRFEEHSKILQEQNKRIEELNLELKKHREQSEKRFEEHSKVIQEMLREIKYLHRKYDVDIGAIGSRWGIKAESSFRNAIKGILEEDFPVKVERYIAFDDSGDVFGKPQQVELDIILKDGKTILGEIKSSISIGDVSALKRKIDFYENKEGKKVDRVIIISPMVDKKALELAKEFGFKVYTHPADIDEIE